MPAKSAAQYRLMQAIAHGQKKKGKGPGPSKEVAKHFIEATPSKKRKEFSKKY